MEHENSKNEQGPLPPETPVIVAQPTQSRYMERDQGLARAQEREFKVRGTRYKGFQVAGGGTATHLNQVSQTEMTRRHKMPFNDRKGLTASQRFLEDFTFQVLHR